MKTCRKCKATKPLTEFWHAKAQPDGFDRICKLCKDANNRKWRAANHDKVIANQRKQRIRRKETGILRRQMLKARFGITPEQYDEMLAEQGGVCAICKSDDNGIDHWTNAPRRLAVDHCHQTGFVRGILCTKCNTGLGGLRDDPELVRRALAYLLERSGAHV